MKYKAIHSFKKRNTPRIKERLKSNEGLGNSKNLTLQLKQLISNF